MCSRLWQSQKARRSEVAFSPFVFLCLYDRISGGAASDKNIKENVCAQIEKNFARAKWKVNPGSFSGSSSWGFQGLLNIDDFT